MIPWVVARELRAALLDYLRSTWGIADAKLETALLSFLAGPNGLFQGPYLRLGLPFASAPMDAAPPLDILPPYPPHLHQLQAWQRLSSRGQAPQATLITTGTGSGKTECFMYPVLDHAYRERLAGKAGIKTIVLYPMNALASDQAQRFADTIDKDERLRGRLGVGLFVGGDGKHREMGPTHVVDDNDRLRVDPPDILLTNYRMLDLLLQRPKDAPLWKHNGPTTLRYLVLDELHTYDGAQGTDVACLIRRLGQRLGSAEAMCPVGTSATVGGGADTRTELLRFAKTLFDQTFPDEAFIGETRLELRDLLSGAPVAEAYPSGPGPWPEVGQGAEAHVRKVAHAWGGPAGEGELDRVALGTWALRLPIVRALLGIAHRRPVSTGDLDAALVKELPRFAAGSEAHRGGWLAAALSLISYAQRKTGDYVSPLVSVQTTLWVREVRRLLSRISGEPAFRFFDEAPPPADEAWVPRYSCRDCGHTGWLLTESGPGDLLGLAYAEVANAFRTRAPALRMVHDDQALADGQDQAGDAPRVAWLDAKTRRLRDKAPDESAPKLFVYEPDNKLARCPACAAADGLRILAARSTTLSSVAVGHLFTTPLNTDRKLLAFSDSVQDAAHRAGFYGARTYRFAMRTAMLAGVPRDGASIHLSDLAQATWDHWLAKASGDRKAFSSEAELTATFLPIDMHWLASAEDWHERLDDHVRAGQRAEVAGEAPSRALPPPGPQLVAEVKDRLRWECTRELGVASRIGRTLEQSGCVSVTVDEARFAKAVADAAGAIRERLGQHDVSDAALSGFLAGLLTRLRMRGGVWDPMLAPYVQSGGNAFLLGKKFAPLLSPFGPNTSRPIFLTNAPKARQFDSVCGSRITSWTVDWVARALGLPLDPGVASEVYLAVLAALGRHGILRALPTEERGVVPGSKATAWGLAPEALWVSRAQAVRGCDKCSGEVHVVAGSITDLLGGPCLRFRCDGRLRAVAAATEDLASAFPLADYYRRFYERETLGRLWSKEHTGLLERGPREELELEFKQRPRPDSPNLLSCTPTLEMGIDIGDLSAALLCSVPPGTAQYVQRVGRAGRKTGNALVLAFAASRPHDLHFFQEPLEAMAGAIHPPGCYLSAPEVLKRQALAFLFDAFAKGGGTLKGGRVRDVIQGEEGRRFPQPLFDFVGPRRERLQQDFLEMFRGELSGTAGAKMSEAFEKGADGLSGIERALSQTTDETRRRRETFRQLVQKVDERLKQLDTDEVEAKKVEDIEDEKRRLRDERAFVYHQLMSLLDKDVWGWLTEESRLPNYAFPERGVKLDAYIRRQGVGREPEHYTWVRSPASALTEFAPFNTFYASARRVQINGVDLKKESPPSRWRFCQTCHHAEPIVSAAPPEEKCPSCGDERWGDVGQAREVLVLGQVFAIANHRDAVLGDDGDDREREFYQTISLFEAKREAREAWSNDAEGFGFELQPEMVLRQINLGKKDDANVQSSQLAGQSVPDVRFIVCGTCGQAQDQSARGNGPPAPLHRAWCPERKKPVAKQTARALHLLRELHSEALRLVVPFADGEDLNANIANLRAALRVGLRKFYGGDPDFLDVLTYDEPLAAREGRRRYVVIMDRVPGGTGLLAELCVGKGVKLKEAIEKAHDVLHHCACQTRVPAVKACYQCLYAYREGQDLPVLERVRALEIVERLLDGFGALAKVDTVGTMTQSGVLESELEARFVRRLEDRVIEAHGTWNREDEGSWRLSVGGRRWLLRAQIDLGSDRVAVPCRADFVLYAEEQEPEVRPVAVFTDGLAYHVMPGSKDARLGDDARKRLGISQGGEMLSWSLTWKDVVSPAEPAVPKWIGDGTPFASLQSLAFRLDAAKPGGKLSTLLRVLDADPLQGLVAYLEAPLRLAELAPLAAFMLLSSGKRQPSVRVAGAHQAWRSTETAADLALETSEGDVATAQLRLGEHGRLLIDAPVSALGSLIGNPTPLRVTLRLEDDLPERGDPGFELSWRLWLRAWNALQVLPGARVVTRNGLSEAAVLESTPPEALPATPPRAAPTDGPDARIDALAEVADAGVRQVLNELLRRYPKLEPPTVPFELRPPAFPIADDVELAFPARKVAAYFDAQSPQADALRAAGWTVFAIERGLNLEALEEALALRED